MEYEKIYIDCDGVILNSEKRLRQMKAQAGFIEHTRESYYEYFKYAESHLNEWDYILKCADQINNSVDIIKKLESLKRKINILTSIHSLYEMRLKVEILRKKWNLESDIIFVPPHFKKNEIVNAKNCLLVDDMSENIKSWNQAQGIGLLFDGTLEQNEATKVKSLEFLL